MNSIKNILDRDGQATYYPAFFAAAESDRYFEILLRETGWKQEPISVYGKTVMQPRLTAWYGDPGSAYRYSGITMHPEAWTPVLLEIRQRVESISPVIFNSALLNQYRDQQDSVGWHRDNEKSLGINPVIGSVSFGAPRKFLFRYYTDKPYSIPLT